MAISQQITLPKTAAPDRPGHKALRKHRVSAEGQVYFLTTTSLYRRPIFREADVSFAVCKALHQPWLWRDSRLLAWVLMPDHWHGLLRLGKADDLATVMGRFKAVTARAVDERHRVNGWLWGRGFHDYALRGNESVRATARYLVANPLRAGLVEDLACYPYWDAEWLGSKADSIFPI
ncbi:MAG TPA: transposase [Arenimonas sp.]|uniref:REP-associated tyrosine transposase n=1 Tax=Arenimonas sp. TaxID=1872635 RepID=UPI002BE41808|nr:transposase [Arenimonas sp.]HMB55912.1 transposase [Arenimonas sp.]